MEIKIVEEFSDKENTVNEPTSMQAANSDTNNTSANTTTEVKLVASGEFKDADNFHKGSGIAKNFNSKY